MSDNVHQVTVQVRKPEGDDPGQITLGYYLLDGAVMTMCDGDGKPVRRINGDLYMHRLDEGQDARAVASRLTREIRSMARGETASAGFYRKLKYPKTGIV